MQLIFYLFMIFWVIFLIQLLFIIRNLYKKKIKILENSCKIDSSIDNIHNY